MTQEQIVEQLKKLKEECIKNGFDWEILSFHLMTEEQHEEWFMNELSKYESNKEEYEQF